MTLFQSPNNPLHWRHNGHDCVSNHQPHDCLLNRLFRRRSKKTPKLRVTGLCAGNSPGPVNSPHKGPVTLKMFPFDDVIMHVLQASSLLVCSTAQIVSRQEERGTAYEPGSCTFLCLALPSDVIWRQRSGSSLAQVMACCLTAPSHYLNQCWRIISKVEWHSSKGKFTRDNSAINHWYYLESLIPEFPSDFPGANELMKR